VKVIVLEGFLSPDDCTAALACFPARVAAEVDHGAGLTVDAGLRRSRTSFLRDATNYVDGRPMQALVERMRDMMLVVNRRHFQFDVLGLLDRLEPLQLAEYGVGDKYDDHLDIGPGAAARRKLSASVQLSDPGEYDGGDLHVWGTGRVERARGTAIVFPSYLVHRVEPVTRGVRLSLVAWAVGAAPYR